MGTLQNHAPPLRWSDYNIEELKLELYEIWIQAFCKKYRTSRRSTLRHLWKLPDDIKKNFRKKTVRKIKVERLQNTTKVAQMYEEMMNKIEPPKYVWPFADLFNKNLWYQKSV